MVLVFPTRLLFKTLEYMNLVSQTTYVVGPAVWRGSGHKLLACLAVKLPSFTSLNFVSILVTRDAQLTGLIVNQGHFGYEPIQRFRDVVETIFCGIHFSCIELVKVRKIARPLDVAQFISIVIIPPRSGPPLTNPKVAV